MDEFNPPIIRDHIPDCELPTEENDPRLWATEYLRRHIEWSSRTFGSGPRTASLLTHIGKEIHEILRNPHDLEEWIDILILAFDGAWRCGKYHDYSPDDILDMLDKKQQKNFTRTWVLPADPTQPCEHQREDDNGQDERETNP